MPATNSSSSNLPSEGEILTKPTTAHTSIFALDRARLNIEPSRPATKPMPSWGEKWLQEAKRPQLQDLDLIPVKHWRERSAWGAIPWKELVRRESHPLHPSKWGITGVVELNGEWYTVFGPDESPLVTKLAVTRIVNYSPFGLERIRLFGGSLGNWKVHTYEGYWRDQIVKSPDKFVGVDSITVGDQWSVKLPITDFYKEGVMVGKMIFTVQPKEAEDLAQVIITEPLKLDLILCNLWDAMGRNARQLYLSREDMLRYRIWKNLPLPEKLVKLTYHENAPRYR